jgi:hypothetical protein
MGHIYTISLFDVKYGMYIYIYICVPHLGDIIGESVHNASDRSHVEEGDRSPENALQELLVKPSTTEE